MSEGLSGQLLGKYRLLKRLARGGMGEVYLARQEGVKGFSKTVVVKRVLDELLDDRQFVEMFINEARLSALLTHPNVVQVFDLGEEEGGLYLAMEYINGHSLRRVIDELIAQGRTIPEPLAARICQQALLGLSYAHNAMDGDGKPLKLVHRDVSPDNILVGYDGSVKMTDFGIAKAQSSQQLTRAGMIKGKIAYMSPEQLFARPLDARSDIFAMAIVLYELVSGKKPFHGETDRKLMLAIANEEAFPLREAFPGVGERLADAVHRALEKQPDNRYRSAAEMADALDAIAHAHRDATSPGAIHAMLIDLLGDSDGKRPTTGPQAGVETREAPRTGGPAMDPLIAPTRLKGKPPPPPPAPPPRSRPSVPNLTPVDMEEQPPTVASGSIRKPSLRNLAPVVTEQEVRRPSVPNLAPVELEEQDATVAAGPISISSVTPVDPPTEPPESTFVAPRYSTEIAPAIQVNEGSSTRTALIIALTLSALVGAGGAYWFMSREPEAPQPHIVHMGDAPPKVAVATPAPAKEPVPEPEPVKPQPPPPAVETPKPEAPKPEGPKPEAPTAGAPKPETPKPETAKPPAVKPDPPKPAKPAEATKIAVAKAEKPPAAPKAAAGKSGYVDLDVVPWGAVFLGNKILGVTPMAPVSVPCGTQTLTVKNLALKTEKSVKVVVPAGETVHVHVDLTSN